MREFACLSILRSTTPVLRFSTKDEKDESADRGLAPKLRDESIFR